MKRIKDFALENNIPIISDEVKDFLCEYIVNNNVKSILEIGSAIGYSALTFALSKEDVKVVTIERNEKLYQQACTNFTNYDVYQQITIINYDALLLDLNELKNNYDLIFIDGAKAQSQKFIEKYQALLSNDGVIIIDNIDFHGFVFNERTTNNRNTRQLVNKIRRFIDWIENNEDYLATYYHTGDGLYVIRKKNKDE